ncbi:MAG: hypothetical protein RLZZ324_304 [Candidatus Parcubacteria bacterium]|jgi:RhtB (resistance to homoserine/threonine) family protein
MSILAFLAIVILAVMSPGPDSILIARNSVSGSRRAGTFTALGIGAGNLVHVGYSLVGIGLLIAKSILLFTVIKTAGALYLVYIGVMALRAKPSSVADAAAPVMVMTDVQAFRSGFLCNVLNPKCTLFFLALFTQLIGPSSSLAARAAYGLAVAGIATSWFSLLAAMLSHGAVKSRLHAVGHHVEHAMGAVLVALGLKVLVTHAK